MSMMKSSVFVGIFLLALVSVIHAACVHEKLDPGTTQCEDYLDKTIHPIGSTWTNSMCQRCSCMASFKSCCIGWPTSVSGGCTIKYDYNTCTFELIHLDKNVHCGAAGK
ncbi:beta-microseminoprotein E1-like [Hemibagrus wyckioides]|uniref:beta-microseminoprotein E1-like n=1 Tax=Hemibagrus wyckioides TaxID=337641 RepID=UPI00266C488F|nr:beta-microseminoprotein E1-like [Hemibagrus wyckioides]